MGNTFYVADLHFGHKNCLAFDDRPFTSIESHDETLIRYWNEDIGIDDDVYILGDVSWHNATTTNKILSQLNGNKHLIIGNHDGKLLRNSDIRNQFCEIVNYKEIGTGSDMIVLSHYPIPCFNNHYYGSVHLYGHVHTGWEWNMMKNQARLSEELYSKPCKMYNVGIMVPYMEWTPKPLEYILTKKPY